MNDAKVALVTGASRGLGESIALALAGVGYRVALNYRISDAAAREVMGRMMESIPGAEPLLLKGDVSRAADAAHMQRMVRERYGRMDVLVNNAGITADALLIKTSLASWEEHMRINLTGAMNMTRAFAPLMIDSGGGHIVNVTSRSGLRGKRGQAAYSASKAALVGFTLSVAKEMGAEGVRVNAVAPGYMPTDMGRSANEAMQEAKAQSVLGTLGSTADVASFICWLAGTRGVSGQVFSLDSRI